MTAAVLALAHEANGYVSMHPTANGNARRAVAQAAERQGAEVYAMRGRLRRGVVDLDSEFAAFANEAIEWADATLEAGAQTWSNE